MSNDRIAPVHYAHEEIFTTMGPESGADLIAGSEGAPRFVALPPQGLAVGVPIPTSTLLPIVGIVLLGAMSPGPDFFVLTRTSATSGRRAGMACALGMGTGIFIWVNAVGNGVAALLVASSVAFTSVKLAGAVYLAFLGIRALLSLREGSSGLEPGVAGPTQSGSRSFREGLLCNLLNPKVAVFYLALLPQFLPSDRGYLPTLELAILAATTVMCWYLVVAVLVASIRRLFASKRVRRALDAVMGTVLVGVGIRMGTS